VDDRGRKRRAGGRGAEADRGGRHRPAGDIHGMGNRELCGIQPPERDRGLANLL